MANNCFFSLKGCSRLVNKNGGACSTAVELIPPNVEGNSH